MTLIPDLKGNCHSDVGNRVYKCIQTYMRDNGKFQDSLLKVCACAIVCGHTGFPALEPLANKPIIFRGKKNS